MFDVQVSRCTAAGSGGISESGVSAGQAELRLASLGLHILRQARTKGQSGGNGHAETMRSGKNWPALVASQTIRGARGGVQRMSEIGRLGGVRRRFAPRPISCPAAC